MNGSIKILPTHLNRQAIVYVRQSDPKQVRQNRESTANQRALRDRVRELTWKEERITIIDGDQGISGKHAAGREEFQNLVADVGLGKVGMIMGYEVPPLPFKNPQTAAAILSRSAWAGLELHPFRFGLSKNMVNLLRVHDDALSASNALIRSRFANWELTYCSASLRRT